LLFENCIHVSGSASTGETEWNMRISHRDQSIAALERAPTLFRPACFLTLTNGTNSADAAGSNNRTMHAAPIRYFPTLFEL
jgi:hypothetical protein